MYILVIILSGGLISYRATATMSELLKLIFEALAQPETLRFYVFDTNFASFYHNKAEVK